MNSWLKHPFRVTGRLFWLGSELFLAALNYAIYCAARPQDSLPSARAAWLQNTSRRLLRVFRIETQFTGDVPWNGLLVCNHLSYLDILVLSALAPCVFVAKREVKHWPVLGWFAKNADAAFDAEDIIVCDNRAVVRWIYRKLRDGQPWHIRGVDVFTVRGGRVAAKLSYVKG